MATSSSLGGGCRIGLPCTKETITGPGSGADCYATAKRDFAVRSDLVPSDTLFSPEQLTEVYRSTHRVPFVLILLDQDADCLR